MFDECSQTPVPILGVRILPTTGKVVPVGGTRPDNQPILPYDTHTEKHSSQPIRVHAAYIDTSGNVSLSCASLITSYQVAKVKDTKRSHFLLSYLKVHLFALWRAD